VETEDEQNKEQASPVPEPEEAKAVTPVSAPVAPPKRAGGALAWRALLLALGALGLSGWMYQQALQKDAALDSRLQSISQSSESNSSRLQQQVERSLMESEVKTENQLAQYQQAQRQQLQSMQSALQSQRQRLLELSSTDRSDWSLAEAEYLTRLAHQRLLMASDVNSALALLSSVDNMVRELDAADLHPLRAALAADMAALRAVPEFDLEGSWLRIQALAGEIDSLLLFRLPEVTVAASEQTVEEDWQASLEHGLQAAAARLASYVVIKRRESPYEPLMDPQWEQLVRQNLHMLLEQAQTALLAGNTVLYRQSLQSARRWVNEFFALDEAGVAALDAELESLLSLDISREYPSITASLTAVKMAVNQRHSAAGS
jgi:uroporphyrin-3 C-methyltransferase